ncbi:periplasmic copper-binding protein [Marinibacterium anthonyi]|nr:periplasmic copper-binding protein [Marinibacterium anthonyi]
MKSLILALPVALSATVALADSHYVNGTVTKVDTQWNRVTIDHEALQALSMPAMTMVFELADPAMIEGLSEGQNIAFVADRVQGRLTVTEIKE